MKHRQARDPDLISRFREFVASADSVAAVEAFLSLLPPPPRHALFRQYVLFSDQDIVRALVIHGQRYLGSVQLINAEANVLELSHTVGRDAPRRYSGVVVVLPGSRPNLYRLTTISYTPFWNNVVIRLVRAAYPVATPTFFRQHEIRDSLLYLEAKLGATRRINIREASMKSERVTDDQRRRAGEYDSERLWTDLAVRDAFDQAKDRGLWFTSLKFEVELRTPGSDVFRSIAHARIYKRGEIQFDYLYDDISSDLLQHLEGYAANRLTLMSHRGLRERDYQPAQPLEILYSSDLFSRTAEVKRFADVIASYPHSTRAVYHGNPYYHASVADYLDGSSFDLWVLSSQRVIIIPQARATAQAIERLIGHIFTEYHEGEIGEYSG